VVDLAKAHVNAVDYANTNSFSVEILNLGTGKGHSVLEVVKAFEKANNLELNYVIGARRSGDVEQIWADASKAKRVLGWEAVLDLEEMMKSAWAWEQQLKKH
jgi:UDP-glucose 4-epimerase